ncbi:hypothetical protein BDW59DRAFT_172544 [Aspergillus cavernicola]|uniref:Uncharacterized protein n=1 Tax=Aspergillus cavernicola TaxID=176166 RepID=A0ABR4IBC5_9EURO
MTSLDDYLDDYDFDLDDYDLGDYGLGDYDLPSDITDYLPTATGSSSSYPTGSSDYDDYDDYGLGDYGDSDDSDDWLDNLNSDDSSSSDSSDSVGSSDSSSSDYDSSDYGSSDYGSSDYDSSDFSGDLPTNGDLPPGFGDYGAIGAGYSSMETSDSCVSEVAFKQRAPKVDLAFDVIFLVLFIAIGGIAAFRLLKSKQKGTALGKWFLFPVSLFFAILYLIIDMITLILSECVMMRLDKYQLAQIAVRWFDSLSVYLLIVLILVPICVKLQQGGGKFASLTLVVHSIWLALCGIFLLVSLAVYSRIQDAIYRTQDRINVNLPKASRGVTMTYYVFLFLGALLASANMFFALFRQANIRKGALLLGTPALIISTLGLTLVLMGGFADREYGDNGRSPDYIEKSGDAQVFLTRLFYAIAFLSALIIAGSHQTVANDTVMQPLAPKSQPVTEYQPAAVVPAEQAHAPVPVPAPYGPAHVA